MPYGSAIAAIVGKYETLGSGNFPSSSRPPIWLDEAPQGSTTGSHQRPPYVVIEDDTVSDDWPSESNGVHSGGFTLSVYYSSLADADQAMAAVLWNGVAPNTRSGVAFMTLDLTAPLYGIAGAVQPTKSRRFKADFVDQNGKPVHCSSQSFTTMHETRGTG